MKKKLSDLNSNELRTKLAKNGGKMNKLQLQNDEIVELLRSRALKAIDVDVKVALTVDQLKAGGWWCDDISEECRVAFVSAGVSVAKSPWGYGNIVGYAYKRFDSEYVRRAFHDVDPERFYQIHRIGNDFYWGAP